MTEVMHNKKQKEIHVPSLNFWQKNPIFLSRSGTFRKNRHSFRLETDFLAKNSLFSGSGRNWGQNILENNFFPSQGGIFGKNDPFFCLKTEFPAKTWHPSVYGQIFQQKLPFPHLRGGRKKSNVWKIFLGGFDYVQNFCCLAATNFFVKFFCAKILQICLAHFSKIFFVFR